MRENGVEDGARGFAFNEVNKIRRGAGFLKKDLDFGFCMINYKLLSAIRAGVLGSQVETPL